MFLVCFRAGFEYSEMIRAIILDRSVQLLDSDACDNWINLITDKYKFIVFLSFLSFTILDTELVFQVNLGLAFDIARVKNPLKCTSSIAGPKQQTATI